jgi:bifunctional DNA-binding transcriptional regulator/antitoxin component of YhaV-PrlF toxin-antitoxin module
MLLRETAHRWGNATATLLVVTVAVGALLGTFVMLRGYALGTEDLLQERRKAFEERFEGYQDDMRKLTKRLGFNTYILPAGVELSAPESQKPLLPESHAHKLARSDLMSINHLVAYLRRPFHWPEENRWITLEGTTDELFIKKQWQKPMLQAVPGGLAEVGYEIHTRFGLEKGDELTIDARKFKVHACLEPQGPIEDETVRIHLEEAQGLLGLEDKISGVFALNCQCSDRDLGMIREEIASLLPGTQVRIDRGKMAVRAQARQEEQVKARRELEAFARTRQDLHAGREKVAAMIAPLVVFGGALAVAGLSWINVRQRRGEIGILRAIGLRGRQLLALVVGKAALLALAGAVLGVPLGFAVVAFWARGRSDFLLPTPGMVTAGSILAGAVVVCMLASWVPAKIAARQDPATILNQE